MRKNLQERFSEALASNTAGKQAEPTEKVHVCMHTPSHTCIDYTLTSTNMQE